MKAVSSSLAWANPGTVSFDHIETLGSITGPAKPLRSTAPTATTSSRSLPATARRTPAPTAFRISQSLSTAVPKSTSRTRQRWPSMPCREATKSPCSLRCRILARLECRPDHRRRSADCQRYRHLRHTRHRHCHLHADQRRQRLAGHRQSRLDRHVYANRACDL